MSFNKGVDFIEAYCLDRADDLHNGRRSKWAHASLNLSNFNHDDELGKYRELINGDNPNIRQIRRLRAKIGWLDTCYRDIRQQYTATMKKGSDTPRNKVYLDSFRYSASYLRYLGKVFFKHLRFFIQ